MIPHTRTILTPPTSDQYHAVLLYIVTLAWYIRRDDPSTAESDFRCLALARIGLFGFRDADFETHAFHLRTIFHGGRFRAARFLRLARGFADLIEGCAEDGGGCEGAFWDGC